MMRRAVAAVILPTLVLSTVGCVGGRFEQGADGVPRTSVAGEVAPAQGRTLGVMAGPLLAALVGQDSGRALDDADELRAAFVLEKSKTGQPTTWANPERATEVTMTPIKTYQAAGGEYCREYVVEVAVGGRADKAAGTACRQSDGRWKLLR